MGEHDLSTAEAEAIKIDLWRAAANLPPETETERLTREVRREERSLEMVAAGRRQDALARYETACPAEFLTSDWEYPEIQRFRPQIDRVLSYEIGSKGLLASGPTGRRKSGAMWALMKRLCEAGHDVRFYSAFDFFGQLQEQVTFGRDDARGWIEAVAARAVVFIDDYGQEQLLRSRQEWAAGWFFRFLDIRAGHHRPLFMTTNLSGHQMAGTKNLRGDPLLRRLLMVCDPVPFETPAERARRR